jgi:hypothetical protein
VFLVVVALPIFLVKKSSFDASDYLAFQRQRSRAQMSVTPLVRYHLAGELFHAHACSAGCSCDPCTCDPCGCGDGRASDQAGGVQWQITGYHITGGQIQQVDIAALTLVKLALTSENGTNANWQEYLLLEKGADATQVAGLVELIQGNLLADLIGSPRSSLPIYLAPLTYSQKGATRARLDLHFTQAECVPVAKTNIVDHLREWSYERHVAIQGTFNLRK